MGDKSKVRGPKSKVRGPKYVASELVFDDRGLKRNDGRHLAWEVLKRVEERGSYASLLLDTRLRRSSLSPAEKRLATELVYGVLRHRGRIDWILEKVSRRSIGTMEAGLRNLLRLGAYQLSFLDRIPPYAAVDEAVKLALSFMGKGCGSFVNAVLREVSRQRDTIPYPDLDTDPVRYIATFHSHPSWLVERWLHRLGERETMSLAMANNRIPPVSIQVNPLKGSPEELRSLLRGKVEAIEESPMVPNAFRLLGVPPLWDMEAFLQGRFAVMDEAAALVVHVLDPRPGETIIDACAGGGGKAALAAMLTQDNSHILALDLSRRALRRLEENISRLGIRGVRGILLDARDAGKRLSEKADRVLVDVPCTGLGTLRRHPEIKWRLKPDSLKVLSNLQLELLEGVLPCLKPGGILVYSTCSTEPEENEGVISQFIQAHPEIEVEDPSPFLPLSREDLIGPSKFLQTWPHRHAVDGFFVARLRSRETKSDPKGHGGL